MFIVGLTGGIGSGKSTVAQHFIELGVACIDADQTAREVVQPGTTALKAISEHFGESILLTDGSLDRRQLRDKVFADEQARQWLNDLLHPLIRQRMLQQCQETIGPYCILMVPLLFESGRFAGLCQRVLVVDCPEQVQIERVRQRSGLAAEQVVAIMAAQLSRADRLARADDVIDNSGARDSLPAQVAGLHRSYLQLSRQPSCSS
mgnify:CR=1 FL=1